jgi:hypothetical protein
VALNEIKQQIERSFETFQANGDRYAMSHVRVIITRNPKKASPTLLFFFAAIPGSHTLGKPLGA